MCKGGDFRINNLKTNKGIYSHSSIGMECRKGYTIMIILKNKASLWQCQHVWLLQPLSYHAGSFLSWHAMECLWLLLSAWEKEGGLTRAIWLCFASWSSNVPFTHPLGHLLCCGCWHGTVQIYLFNSIFDIWSLFPSTGCFSLFWRCFARASERGVNWSLLPALGDSFKVIWGFCPVRIWISCYSHLSLSLFFKCWVNA